MIRNIKSLKLNPDLMASRKLSHPTVFVDEPSKVYHSGPQAVNGSITSQPWQYKLREMTQGNRAANYTGRQK